MVAALDGINGNFRDIKRAQDGVKKAVLDYNEFITSTQLSPYSNLYKKSLGELKEKILIANSKMP